MASAVFPQTNTHFGQGIFCFHDLKLENASHHTLEPLPIAPPWLVEDIFRGHNSIAPIACHLAPPSAVAQPVERASKPMSSKLRSVSNPTDHFLGQRDTARESRSSGSVHSSWSGQTVLQIDALIL